VHKVVAFRHTDINNQHMNLNNGDNKQTTRSTLDITKQAP